MTIDKILAGVEKAGNKLPHPFYLFLYLAVFVLICSLVCGLAGVSAVHPVTKETIAAQNLLSQYGLQKFVLEMVSNFSGFPPLGVIVVLLCGISLSVHTGLIEAMLGRLVRVPDMFILPVIVIAGIMGNLAGDAGIVVVPPLAAVAFKKLGKNPMAGIILAYAACTAGFTATLIPRSTDVILAGFTNAALTDPNLHVGAAANLYFMIVSLFMLGFVMAWVAKKFTLPVCGDYEPEKMDAASPSESRLQKKGLLWAAISLAIYVALIALTFFPENGILRYNVGQIKTIEMSKPSNTVKYRRVLGRTQRRVVDGIMQYEVAVGGKVVSLPQSNGGQWSDGAVTHVYCPEADSEVKAERIRQIKIMPNKMHGPFFKGMVAILFFVFAVPGVVYGLITGSIKKPEDVPAMMSKSVKGVSGMIVLVVVMAQFIAFFQWSNLDKIVAISGANFLNQVHFQGIPLLIVTIIIVAILNLFIGSSSAKWAMLAPVLVPMFLYLQPPVSPAVSQLVYRLGDSATNGISPLYPYFPLALGWLREYRKDAGIGTLIRLLLPYALFTGISWILLLLFWYFLGLPIGPAEAIR